LLSDTQSDAIVGTILSLGRALKLPITAEGIEDAGTSERLRSLGCSDGRGWLFGKAISGDAVRASFGIQAKSEIQHKPHSSEAIGAERRDRRRRAASGKG
jgi:EAL domain-containing protein (putative c-di-GMP-specific phosphodiesterase class I)